MNKFNKAPNVSSQNKGSKKDYATKLFEVLKKPMSRRMAATLVGYADQTYMVTQLVNDWIEEGRAQVIGVIKCTRSNRIVESVTTNRDLFISKVDNQLQLFDKND